MDDQKLMAIERKADCLHAIVAVVAGIGCIVLFLFLPFDLTPSDNVDTAIGALLATFCFAYAVYKFVRRINRRNDPPRVNAPAPNPDDAN
jgi:amino acid transporter